MTEYSNEQLKIFAEWIKTADPDEPAKPPQITEAQLVRMTPAQVMTARREGQLTDLLNPNRKENNR